jgi:hypothetical protein
MRELLEVLGWLTEQEAEAENHYQLCEVMGDNSDTDYAHGRYEAYGVARSKVRAMVEELTRR